MEADEKIEEGQRPVFIKPDGFRVKFWKSEELAELELKTVETQGKIYIANLFFKTKSISLNRALSQKHIA